MVQWPPDKGSNLRKWLFPVAVLLAAFYLIMKDTSHLWTMAPYLFVVGFLVMRIIREPADLEQI